MKYCTVKFVIRSLSDIHESWYFDSFGDINNHENISWTRNPVNADKFFKYDEAEEVIEKLCALPDDPKTGFAIEKIYVKEY